MTIGSTRQFIELVVMPAALAMLPAKMDSPEARALLVAIGLQESRFTHRRQQLNGPAHGFWQFESAGGVHGVLTHHATKPFIQPVLDALRYEPSDCYYAIRDNDILACVFARLLLFSHPAPLPREAAAAWDYYLATWRPGKPRRDTWDGFFIQALNDTPGVRA